MFSPACILSASRRRRFIDQLALGNTFEDALRAVEGEWRDFAFTLAKHTEFRDGVREALGSARELRQWMIEDTLYRCAITAARDPRFQTTAIWCSKALCGWGERNAAAKHSLPGDAYRDEFGGELAGALGDETRGEPDGGA